MLIKLGHMEAPPQEEKVDLHKLDLPEQDPHVEKLENATLDELDEFEDDEDDRILEEYRYALVSFLLSISPFFPLHSSPIHTSVSFLYRFTFLGITNLVTERRG